MIPRGSMAIIVEELARSKFDEHCKKLDERLEGSLRTALGDKRISKERQNVIVNEFCDCMEG